jgi:CBS-domain-containing membrane protein
VRPVRANIRGMDQPSMGQRIYRVLPVKAANIRPIEIIGSMVAIGSLLLLNHLTMDQMSEPLFVAPLAASIAIIFIQPGMSVARSWNVVAGQFLSALVGLLCVLVLGGHLEIAAMLALGLALVVMRAFHCLHPPACATAMIIVLTPTVQTWKFLFFPVLFGAVVVVLVAWGVHLIEERMLHNRLEGRTPPAPPA